MESTSFRFSSLLFFFIIAVIAGYSDVVVGKCTYTISVKTGAMKNAGTDSTIKLILGDANGETITIPDLAAWGLNGPSYDYFEMGHLDYFNGKETCISVCNIIVASDGTGNKAGWYLSYVDVVTTGSTQLETLTSSKITFPIDQWLALDEYPNTLVAHMDKCDEAAGGAGSANRKVHANKRSGSAFDIVRALE